VIAFLVSLVMGWRGRGTRLDRDLL
jgi:hypothetical protein